MRLSFDERMKRISCIVFGGLRCGDFTMHSDGADCGEEGAGGRGGSFKIYQCASFLCYVLVTFYRCTVVVVVCRCARLAKWSK